MISSTCPPTGLPESCVPPRVAGTRDQGVLSDCPSTITCHNSAYPDNCCEVRPLHKPPKSLNNTTALTCRHLLFDQSDYYAIGQLKSKVPICNSNCSGMWMIISSCYPSIFKFDMGHIKGSVLSIPSYKLWF